MHMQEWIKRDMPKESYALITGTTSGIGLEYAKKLASYGCNLICVSNEEDKLKNQKTQFEKQYNVQVEVCAVDLADTQATVSLAKKLAQKEVFILINNAGFGLKGHFGDISLEKYIDVIAVNATAPVVFTHAVLPQMQKRNKGLIMHIASINALVPIPKSQVYSASKSFCLSYALALSRENKNSDIKFQIVLPGTTDTPFHVRQGANPQRLVMTPDAVAEASLQNIDSNICIPNQVDKILAKIIPLIPRKIAADLAGYILKKRLGV